MAFGGVVPLSSGRGLGWPLSVSTQSSSPPLSPWLFLFILFQFFSVVFFFLLFCKLPHSQSQCSISWRLTFQMGNPFSRCCRRYANDDHRTPYLAQYIHIVCMYNIDMYVLCRACPCPPLGARWLRCTLFVFHYSPHPYPFCHCCLPPFNSVLLRFAFIIFKFN